MEEKIQNENRMIATLESHIACRDAEIKRLREDLKDIDRMAHLLDALDKLFRDEFKSLADKSDKAETDALKYIYANQAIGINKALDILTGSRQLVGV